jgi:hypothetical protein
MDAGFACTLALMKTHPWLDNPETFSNPSVIGCAAARADVSSARQKTGNTVAGRAKRTGIDGSCLRRRNS